MREAPGHGRSDTILFALSSVTFLSTRPSAGANDFSQPRQVGPLTVSCRFQHTRQKYPYYRAGSCWRRMNQLFRSCLTIARYLMGRELPPIQQQPVRQRMANSLRSALDFPRHDAMGVPRYRPHTPAATAAETGTGVAMVCWRGSGCCSSFVLPPSGQRSGCQSSETADRSRFQAGPCLPDEPARLDAPRPRGRRSRAQDQPPRNQPAEPPAAGQTRGARIRAVVNGEAILDEEVVAAAFSS